MKDLTKDQNIYKTFILFAFPLILSGLLSQAYSIVDTVIAGKTLSAQGLGAIGSTSAFIQLFSSIFWGYGTGFSIYIARLFGAGEYEKLKSSLYVNALFFIVMILVLSTLAVVFYKSVFAYLHINSVLVEDAFSYYRIYMLGIVFILLNNLGVFIVNAFGDSVYPLIMSLISTVVHILGNIFAVVVLKAGVAGIAVSSVCSGFVIDVLYFMRIRKYFKMTGVEKSKIKFSFSEIKMSMKYSVPTMVQQMIMYISSTVISPMINGISAAATASYTICNKIYDINASVYQNSAKTLSNYEAQSLGAKKYYNVMPGLKVGFIQGMAICTPIILITVIFAKQFCCLFLPKGYSGESLGYSLIFVRYFMPFVLFNLVNNLFHSFYRGVAAMKTLILATFIGAASRVAASYLLIRNYGMNAIFMGWVISWIIECIFTLLVFVSGKWKPEELIKYEKELQN